MEPFALSAVDLQRALAARELSCADVMASCLDRIEAVNAKVNAVVSLLPRDTLMEAARAADAQTGPRGPLHGFPFAIKDLVETAGIRTTHGSPLHADHVPLVDDLLAARIRGAGAIVIGKTNTPEFGLGSHSFNPVHGVTRNPYNLSRTAGGSSGGAAAALATRMVPLADGSDTMGSLRNPAAFCNVYGFRPSFGRVPRDPVGDLFLSQISTDGPMARSPRDLALLLDVIAGPAAHDPLALPAHASFLTGLDQPSGASRVGWLGDWASGFPLEPGIAELCESALKVFVDMGLAVEPVMPATDLPRLLEAWRVLRSFNNAASKRQLLVDPSTRDLIKPELVYEIETGLARTAMEVHEASVARSEWFVEAASLFERFDVLVLPSAQVFSLRCRHPLARVCRRLEDGDLSPVDGHRRAGLHRRPADRSRARGLFRTPACRWACSSSARAAQTLPLLQLGQAYHQATEWPQRRPPEIS